MRIGLFGGTFDPVHAGHLILAERCREDAGFDQVWFLPSYQPPHKADRVLARFEHRSDMLTLATTGQPAFKVDPVERDLPTPSYTARTLAAIQAMHPADTFALILGADCLPDLSHWYQPAEIVTRAELVVVPRAGVEFWPADRVAAAVGVPAGSVKLTAVVCPLVEISSRDVRGRVAAGRSVRFLVPRAVEEFIRERKLYRPPA